MTPSAILALGWLVLANVAGMFPSKKGHWPTAYALIALGIPILGFLTYQNGPFYGLLMLLGGASVLRWPLIYLWRWARRVGGKRGA